MFKVVLILRAPEGDEVSLGCCHELGDLEFHLLLANVANLPEPRLAAIGSICLFGELLIFILQGFI